MPRIALATFDPSPEPHPDRDLPVLVEALRTAGADAVAVPWDDPATDWGAFDLVLIRSTWDYTERPAEFTAWARRVAAVTRLANPADVVRWNTDKRYLGDLAAAGVPTVPTRYLAPGDAADLPDGPEFVVKPATGAGARLAARYRPGLPGERDRAAAHVARMHDAGLVAMVQPYMAGIDAEGERAVQFLGGRLLHASRKRAVLEPGIAYDADKVAHPGLEVWTPTPRELAVAEAALAAVPGGSELLYARVDLVTGDDGLPRVMELELVEPNLFLFLHPESLPVVTSTVLAAAGSGGAGGSSGRPS
ncbi:ATP-grasp domain-containing protein [Streptomyces mangrovisoli]|uniref:ATP-grasp domain-containing protein n=1 Tax=Streptomyces mangrovisoli TaxID=1428628 RepID=A0A1J4NUS4_9ACTN|nr:hypothetical protein [Streptomyces mangrovisoli]OIJ66249.1 hypothetical protein WN71_019600 [Streptomyces mangrovisoli]